AAQRATTSIPIVSVVNDPVAAGFVASVARPGGNVTGLSMMSPEVVGKQLELLREVVPKVSRVAVLANPANPGSAPQLRHAEVVAKALGMRLQLLEARSPSEIDSAFARIARACRRSHRSAGPNTRFPRPAKANCRARGKEPLADDVRPEAPCRRGWPYVVWCGHFLSLSAHCHLRGQDP